MHGRAVAAMGVRQNAPAKVLSQSFRVNLFERLEDLGDRNCHSGVIGETPRRRREGFLSNQRTPHFGMKKESFSEGVAAQRVDRAR